jgi:hypothetical protein
MTRSVRPPASRLPVHTIATIIALLTVAACGPAPVPVLTPTPSVVATRLTAEVYGKLVLVDGCLRVNTDYGTSYLLVQPPGFVMDRHEDKVRVADTIMGEAAEWRIGDMVWLGGGEIPNLDEQTRQSVPAQCAGAGPYWLAGGLEMPVTMRNLVLFLEFKGVQVESTDKPADHGFSTTGYIILADREHISVYEFVNAETAQAEAALVSPDGFTITREQGDEMVVRHIEWLGTPHFYHKDLIIAIYTGDDVRTMDLLQALLGPPFAGGN